jgi:protein arginine kinase
MNIEHFLKNSAPSWVKASGEDADILMSTRIRLARNLNGYHFPISFTQEEALQIDEQVMKSLLAVNEQHMPFSYFSMKDIPLMQRQVLVEKHLISPSLASGENSASVYLTKDESVSVMVNEEDHIRIQVLSPGLYLQQSFQKAMEVDQILAQSLHFAYDDQFGFLTSCPTNVGTGLRASVMLHLPALTMVKKMNVIIQTLARLGMTVRGIYGEGSENLGNIYQISNQITLGKSEQEILEDLESVVIQIIEKERLARKQLFARAPIALEDRLFRSLGTLMYAKVLTSEEAATCLSNVRLGVDLGVIQNISLHQLNECMLLIQPGFIQQYANTTLQGTERDLVRAQLMQQKLTLNNQYSKEYPGEKGEDLYDV